LNSVAHWKISQLPRHEVSFMVLMFVVGVCLLLRQFVNIAATLYADCLLIF
jgi:hypothetical protein